MDDRIPDFGGYATKANLRCSDGRVIKAEAFQHMDGQQVPLVWQHGHNEASNILGHVKLEARSDGVYAYGFFNNSKNGQNAKDAVEHGDLTAMSIFANKLKEIGKVVSHGMIREVSLVLAGANPGAKIDFVRLQHSEDPNDFTELDDEAIISHMGELDLFEPLEDDTIEHADEENDEDDGETVQDVYDSLNEKQKDVVQFMIGAALEGAGGESAEHTDTDDSVDNDNKGDLAHQEGSDMSRNVFQTATGGASETTESHTLSHDDLQGIVASAIKRGTTLKDAVEDYALKHGIENIGTLFPDHKNITGAPELEKRRTEWVADVLANVSKTPFSRIKTMWGDLTQDEARAKGYIKGNYKKEEWFGVTKRTTSPTTVYKKQQLDRDDILDITDFDVVLWLKAEMRLMMEEEIARAILIGDGRDVSDEDKVKDPMGASSGDGIRSILNDHEVFVTTLPVNVSDTSSSYEEVVDALMNGMEFYKGTGVPTLYTTVRHLNKFKVARDGNGRRFYENDEQVRQALGVKKIVTVEALQAQAPDVIGIVVNLADYNTGTDRGGELTMFDDFDIDYNKYKYLMETRFSGALTKPKSALVLKMTGAASVEITAVKPSFVASTGVITIPNVTGITYKADTKDGSTLTAGPQTALAAGASKVVVAVAGTNYHFPNTVEDSWTFKRPSA